jgi:hypothetical protein
LRQQLPNEDQDCSASVAFSALPNILTGMPSFEQHCAEAQQRFGKPYAEVEVRQMWGDEAA